MPLPIGEIHWTEDKRVTIRVMNQIGDQWHYTTVADITDAWNECQEVYNGHVKLLAEKILLQGHKLDEVTEWLKNAPKEGRE